MGLKGSIIVGLFTTFVLVYMATGGDFGGYVNCLVLGQGNCFSGFSDFPVLIATLIILVGVLVGWRFIPI